MNPLKNLSYTFIISLFAINLSYSQQILIDGNFDDWNTIEPIFIDGIGDGQNNGIDLTKIWITSDANNFYLKFTLGKEIDLSENNELAIYIDYDNNINTGYKINGIGAELRYFFGERFGIITKNSNNEFVNFNPIGLRAAPTVTGEEFELSFSRIVSESGINFEANSEISFRIEDNGFGGDEIPNGLSGIKHVLSSDTFEELPYNFNKSEDTDFRVLSYNIELDQLFDSNKKEAFKRLFKVINPDIIALQEVRNHSSEETKNLISEFLPTTTWYHKKLGYDIVTLSKYPILYSEPIDGNSAYYLDVNGNDVVLINCHLYCCDNDTGRQNEVDNIMSYIRKLKNGDTNYNVQEGAPIIILGDMNFVGNDDQPSTLKTGNIANNNTYGPDLEPDWDNSDLGIVQAIASGTNTDFTWINSFSSYLPGKLDWIFYTDSKIDVKNAFGIYTPSMSQDVLSLYNLQKHDTDNTADHLPIVVDFSYGAVQTTDILDSDVQIFPNPVFDKLQINAFEAYINRVVIIDSHGKQCLNQKINHNNNFELNVSHFKSGMYYLVMYTGSGKIIRNVVKQ
ncbi:MAG: endonuclease/exonuclease/phosphatase family protein [Saprospiraceae bacterium]